MADNCLSPPCGAVAQVTLRNRLRFPIVTLFEYTTVVPRRALRDTSLRGRRSLWTQAAQRNDFENVRRSLDLFTPVARTMARRLAARSVYAR